jgi:hypothetical protein
MVLNDPTNVTDHSGFAIESIEGLGPVDADINMTEMVTDGDQFNSARIGKRNLVFNLMHYGEYGNDIQGVRRRSYSLFPVKKQVYVEIETDDRTVWTKGYVEKNEPSIFENGTKSQVSILCPDNKLYDVLSMTTTLEEDTTETPIYNALINYTGEVAVGGYLTITFGTDVERTSDDPVLVVSCVNTNGEASLFGIYVPVDGFSSGDTLTISSIDGNKFCIWTDAAEAENPALNLLTTNPDWITIYPGITDITVSGDVSIIDSIVFKNPICYEGV